ncbi:MAG: metal ABC transporter substrate-binding protein [Thermomicrobium sp.]|nr:metal ABC transporter substrate-binding protein [Thermomicrobium sp.]MDW8060407.1 metal ABC transporter substrate-binding protein [Thermomicrobium sp.]
MRVALVWLAILLAGSVAACRGAATPTPTTGAMGETTASAARRLVVVTSIPIFATMVEVVGGEFVEASAVMPPGTDPHTYQPVPRDVAKLAVADLVVYNGGDLDPWMERQLEATGSRARVVVLSEGLEPPPGVGEEEAHAGETPAVEHEHGVNPHFWLDPDFGIIYVQRIAEGLAQVDPARAETYRANAERYIAEIRAFDEWAKEQIATIPPERRKLVTFHDAFPYFAAHYGLELVGVVILSPGREPSPQEVAQLVERIRSEGVPAIFVEPQFNPKLAETIAQEAGVRVLELYSDAAPAGTDYLGMMRRNVTNVVEGLRG